MRSSSVVLLGLVVLVAAMMKAQSASDHLAPDLPVLRTMTARFAPADIGADLSELPEQERRALARLVEAAKIMDGLFLRQVWAGNETLLLDLVRDRSPLGQARLKYFLINKGPWSRLDDNAPFIPGVPRKPAAGNFYPADARKEDVERWFKALADEAHAAATGFFTTIRRAPGGAGGPVGFITVPYSQEYQGELGHAAGLLRDAATQTKQPTLKRFLSARADAFLSNDYYESDLAWMELDASIEPTIGPYEVYEDEWFNYKAAFEAFIALRDRGETDKLARFGRELQDIENSLPIEPRHRNPTLGALAPIRVVNVVVATGDANRGVQTAAYNLPNDERIVLAKGTKRVMLKNVQSAKFEMVLVPISRIALSPDQRDVSFDAFFTHILMHELMHGLGPHSILADGKSTTVRATLRDTYSSIEEAKADVSGLFAVQRLLEKGVLDRSLERSMYTTFLASAFRSIRFGLSDAHGRGMAVQINYLLDRGGFLIRPDGTFAVDPARIEQGVVDLTRELMTIQAEGSYAKARDLLDRLGVVRPEVQRVLDRLGSIPVDIEPRFTTAETLVAR